MIEPAIEIHRCDGAFFRQKLVPPVALCILFALAWPMALSGWRLATERKVAHERAATDLAHVVLANANGAGGQRGLGVLFWLFVGVPLAWGV